MICWPRKGALFLPVSLSLSRLRALQPPDWHSSDNAASGVSRQSEPDSAHAMQRWVY